MGASKIQKGKRIFKFELIINYKSFNQREINSKNIKTFSKTTSGLYIKLKNLLYIIFFILISLFINLSKSTSGNILIKSSEITLKIKGPGVNILIISSSFFQHERTLIRNSYVAFVS